MKQRKRSVLKRTAQKRQKGVLTIEASISYSIFLMIIVTLLYLMRVVYAYGLVQHAVSQTAKELSMYTYVYHVSGASGPYDDLQSATSGRKDQFNTDAESIVKLYEILEGGKLDELNDYSYEGSTHPKDILKDVIGAVANEAAGDAHNQAWTLVARPMIAGYIGADSKGNSADERLQKLRVIGGLKGIDLSSSKFFENGTTIDIVACYTIDPLLPIKILPELNLCNRATVRGMSGSSIF